MSTIFIIIGSTGEYSDRTQWLEKAFGDRTAADEYCAMLNAREAQRKEWGDKVGAAMREWEKENPLPNFPTHLLKKEIKWTPGLRKEQITAEMRAERDAVLEYNRNIHREYGKNVRDPHMARVGEVQREFLVKFGADDGYMDRYRSYMRDIAEYYVDDVEFV